MPCSVDSRTCTPPDAGVQVRLGAQLRDADLVKVTSDLAEPAGVAGKCGVPDLDDVADDGHRYLRS
jgi:hypothetical protein